MSTPLFKRGDRVEIRGTVRTPPDPCGDFDRYVIEADTGGMYTFAAPVMRKIEAPSGSTPTLRELLDRLEVAACSCNGMGSAEHDEHAAARAALERAVVLVEDVLAILHTQDIAADGRWVRDQVERKVRALAAGKEPR